MKTMKRTFAVAVALWSVMVVPGLAEDARVYQNKEAGVKVEYPNEWRRADKEGGSVAMFLSPDESAQDPFPEYVGLYVNKLVNPADSLETYTAISEKEVGNDKNAKLIKSEPAVFGGQPGHRMTGTTKSDAGELKWIQIWTVKNGKVYMAAYVGEKKSYKKFLGEAEKIIASFSII